MKKYKHKKVLNYSWRDIMKLSDEILSEISYVTISKNRTKVMKTLYGTVKIPSKISKDTGILTNHVSSLLGKLKKHGLVECINPEARKGRLYRLTDKGEKVVENISSFELS